jgi:hypothetical protein
MLKVNLEKEVRRQAAETKTNLNPENVDLKEIKGLLEYKSLEDSFILNNLGINSLNAQIQEDKGKLLIMEKIEKATNLTVVHVNDIQKLCEKYRLRFLPTNRYKGIIPTDIITNIKALEESKRENHANFTKFDQYQLKNEFFILAPVKMFKLDEKVVVQKESRIGRAIRDFWAYWNDPILFYKEDDQHYVIVRKWGSDFTIFRRILGLITKNQVNYFISLLIAAVILIGATFFITHNTDFLLYTSLFCLSIVAFFGKLEDDNFFTKNNWCSQYK